MSGILRIDKGSGISRTDKVSGILRIEKDFLEPETKSLGENQGFKGLKGFLDRVKSEE